MVCYSTVPTLLRWLAWLHVAGFYVKVDIQIHWELQNCRCCYRVMLTLLLTILHVRITLTRTYILS